MTETKGGLSPATRGGASQMLISSAHATSAGAARRMVGPILPFDASGGPGPSLGATDLTAYDAVVLFVGTEDAISLLPPRRWKRELRSLLAAAAAAGSASTRIILVGIPASASLLPVAGLPALLAARRAAGLNKISRAVTAEFMRVSYLSYPGRQFVGRGFSGPGYRELSAEIADRISHLIDIGAVPGIVGRMPGTPQEARTRQYEEDSRQSSLDVLALGRLRDDSGLARVVEIARVAFGTAFATVTIVDNQRVWMAAGAGLAPMTSKRKDTFCAHTVLGGEALIVQDALDDPRFADIPAVRSGGIRFYAGFPIESPDGYRIGALCVFDTHPRSIEDMELALLRDLAQLVQREFAELAPVLGGRGVDLRRSASGVSSR